MGDITRGVAICGFTGVNGAGKTLAAVDACIEKMRAGRVVYSTVPIDYTDRKTGRRYQSQPVVSLRQLLELRDCTILFDEVAVIFSSRTSQSLPAEIVVLLQTLRHRRIDVIWTAPAWMACDNQLRRVTRGVVNVVPLLNRHDGIDPWGRPRMVMLGLMDTVGVKIDAAPVKVLRRRFLRPKGARAWGSYDTHADSPLLGAHLVTGNCPDCGGSITRQKHSKALHDSMGLPWYDSDRDVEARRSLVAFSGPSDDSEGVNAIVGDKVPGESLSGAAEGGSRSDREAPLTERTEERLSGGGITTGTRPDLWAPPTGEPVTITAAQS